MDLGTLVGLLATSGLVFAACFLGGSFSDFVGAFVDVNSIVLVIVGSFAVVLMQFPLKVFFGLGKVIKKTLISKPVNTQELIEQMVQLGDKARKESIVALEKVSINDPFLARGIQLVADGTELGLLRNILDIDMALMRQRHWRGQDILKTFGTFSPAMGMIGTLIGLVQMLKNMDDPNKIGPAMAIALLTTLYGSLMANVIFLPLAKKLEERSNEEYQVMELVREGVIAIQKGEHPALMREKLESFLPARMRAKR